jgi:outer membrane lipoprotein-sorting protein
MMIRPIDPATEHSMLVDDTDEDHAVYILLVFGNDSKGNAVPLRSIWFDRVDLSITRQEIYAPNSNILSDTRYSDWTIYSGINFPKSIDINRPIDGYGVSLDVVNMKMNVPVTDQQFVLQQPPGTTLQTIGASGEVSAPIAPAKNQK